MGLRMVASPSAPPSGSPRLAVLVAALGYFVDIYDLVLFSIVRKPSLEALGLRPEEVLDRGVLLIDMQMGGMIVGGVLWGVLGDRRGRLSVLFGSILLYSVANIANAFVWDLPSYAAMRLLAGIGLAGELGAGITLVSESLGKHARGYGTTLVATVGITGAVVGALVGGKLGWKGAYLVGGGLGLALLALRVGVLESGMFTRLRDTGTHRGDFTLLFRSWPRARRYVAVVLVGVPIWYVVGILVTFSPELGRALGMAETPDAGRAIMFAYIGLAAGDFASGAASQLAKSRKKILLAFLMMTTVAVATYFVRRGASLTEFYAICVFLGFATGYWAVFVTVAAEQFGTNLRATATTSAPNFVRGAVVPLTLAFKVFKERLGVAAGAMLVGALTLAVAFAALAWLEETYGRDLDFLET